MGRHFQILKISFFLSHLIFTYGCSVLCFLPVEISTVFVAVHSQLFETPWTAAHQASLSFTISQRHPPSVIPFSSCLQSFPASGSFPMSWHFASGGQSTGVSASASVLSKNIQDLFPLGLTGLILQSKGLSRVFSSTTVQKHQFFSAQPSL